MKKRTLCFILGIACTLLIGSVLAAGGDAGDPLISLSFLTKTFTASVDKSTTEALDRSDKTLYDGAEAQWKKILASAEASVGTDYTAVFKESRLKQDDILSGPTGLQVILLAGSMKVEFSAGAVVDVTTGKELASGAPLSANHRYLVAEDTAVLFSVTSKTAVADYCGAYSLTHSAKTDYNAMAEALKALHLFRGSDTGYGQGFDLERTPTRTEALVMLIRLLGEEDAALACTGTHPFRDVDDWAVPYVAYAYEKGYSNGVGSNQFGSAMNASVQMYTEFILRALGYSSTAQTDISDALIRAQSCGAITAGECATFGSGTFLRADVVYLSYYALDVPISGSAQTLGDKLAQRGVFAPAQLLQSRTLVTSARL